MNSRQRDTNAGFMSTSLLSKPTEN